MQLRILALQRGEQIGEIAEWQFCVQSARYVKFSGAFGYCLTGNAKTVLNIVSISIRLPGSAVEAAELTVYITYVRWVEMAIDIEIGGCAMKSPSNGICEFSQGRQVICSIQRHAVFESQTLAGAYSFGDFVDSSIV